MGQEHLGPSLNHFGALALVTGAEQTGKLVLPLACSGSCQSSRLFCAVASCPRFIRKQSWQMRSQARDALERGERTFDDIGG